MYQKTIALIMIAVMLCTLLCSCEKRGGVIETTVQTEAEIGETQLQNETVPVSSSVKEKTEINDCTVPEPDIESLLDKEETETESSETTPAVITPSTIPPSNLTPSETEKSPTNPQNDEAPLDPDQGEII